MDSNFVIKPRAAAERYTPRDPVRVREAVGTDLAMDKAVAAASGDDRPGDQRHGQGSQDQPHDHPAHEHAPEVVVDPESRAVIYRERDVRTEGGQHPDQALLRQRAYRPAPPEPEKKPGLDTEPHADVKA